MIELSYCLEDPTPWLNVVLGLRELPTQLMVGLWRLYPAVPSLSTRATNQFDSAESLFTRLVVIRDDWLATFIWPAFEQPERFRSAWRSQQDETEQAYEANVRRQRLTQARWAYDHGDLARALERYTLAGLDLSAADQRRYRLAQRGPGG